MRPTHAFLFLLVLALALPALDRSALAKDEDLAPKLRAALVTLQVTSQAYDRTSPWQLGNEYTREGRGVVVKPGVILTESSLVTNQRMIEISVANSARRYPGRLRHVDRTIGLALIEFDDPQLEAQLAPLPLGEPVKLDDECDIWQLGRDNIPERYDARVIRAIAGSSGLTLQLKTTCSDDGNGQACLKDGALVGLVTSTYGSRQQATIIALETIRQYLADFDDGAYHGRPGPGFWTHQLLRQDLRTYYGLAEDQHGIAVSRVVSGRTGEGVLQENDVLLGVDGYDIDDEGKFVHEVHGRLSAGYLLSGRRFAGDTVKATILREGEVQEVEVELKGQAPSDERVPDAYEMARPQYLVVGGLVLLELISNSSISRSPGGVILRRYRERQHWDPPTERKRVVYVDRVLSDVSNKGFENLFHQPLESVNGVTIHEFADVTRALETPQDGYHVFRFEGLQSDFVVPAAERDAIDRRIADRYKVTRLSYFTPEKD